MLKIFFLLFLFKLIPCTDQFSVLDVNGFGELKFGQDKSIILSRVQIFQKRIIHGEENINEFIISYNNQKLAIRFKNNFLNYIELLDSNSSTSDGFHLGITYNELIDKCKNIKVYHSTTNGGFYTANCNEVMYYFSTIGLTDDELNFGIKKDKYFSLKVSRIYIFFDLISAH